MATGLETDVQTVRGALMILNWIHWRHINCCKTTFFIQIGHLLESKEATNRNLDRSWLIDNPNFWWFSVRQTDNVEDSVIFGLWRLWLVLWFVGFRLAIGNLVIWWCIRLFLFHNPYDETAFSKEILNTCVGEEECVGGIYESTYLQMHKPRSTKRIKGTPIIKITEIIRSFESLWSFVNIRLRIRIRQMKVKGHSKVYGHISKFLAKQKL